MEYLQQNGVSTRPGTHAVHMLGYYARTFGIKPEDFPGAFAANEYSMSIPLHNKMNEADYNYVADLICNL
jgi:dTDP-4-amino-4,6-dideoxygalactose transaminase